MGIDVLIGQPSCSNSAVPCNINQPSAMIGQSSSAVPCNVDQSSAMIGQSSYSNSSVPCNIDQSSGKRFLPVATFTNNPVVPPQIVHMAPLAKPYISPSLKATLSLIPKKKKFERIVSQRQYQKLEKAGRLAVRPSSFDAWREDP